MVECTSMSTTEPLLPCPFCGGEAELVDSWTCWVRCKICKVETGDYGNPVKATAAWNRRAGPPAAVPEELPAIPDDDSDFTPDLARKIIAKYQELVRTLTAAPPAVPEAVRT